MVTKTCGEKFRGSNVQECLSLASSSLGVPVEKLKYSILEEKNGFFKKHAIISIDSIEGLNDENIKDEDFSEKEVLKKDTQKPEINGTIEIQGGRIIVKDPCEGGKPAVICFGNNITVIINGEKINKPALVTSESKIEFVFEEDKAKRKMDLRISEDKMEAYISIRYKPTTTYKLKDAESSNAVTIAIEIKEEIMPPKFTESEIKNELLNSNIKYGILKMSIIKCTSADEISELLIASGKKPIEKIDDIVEIKYNESEAKDNQQNDNVGAIDYKAIGTVSGVEVGQVLAIHYPGKNGEDGIDIAGKIIKAKNAKKIILGVGDGCALKDEFTVVATSKGRPSAKGNTFFVYKTHEINGDVELKTGNIKFVGDIVISGSVREGMKVEAGNSVLIKNNVSEAEITANGDVVINGNVIHSSVSAGKEDVLILEYLSDLNSMENDITKLIASIRQLKEMNLLERNTSDGELIKILMETKFKKLSQTSIKVAKRILKLGNVEDELLFIIKNKILDLGPLNIKSYEELNATVTIIKNKISTLSMNLTLPVDVVLDYCQDSIIKSSGNITFSGKGQYVSQIEASDSVIFQNDKSVARGGVIKAGKEIKCKIVGGPGGVATKLIVENHGHIWAEVAHPNTRFIIGTREYILDAPSKQIHAFIDENRELAVDKLLL
ncbi:flagellar assembly protein A [Clostridium sp. FP1]|uniref:flagellar assembly protein A n=1 Tax=Clostridium sp. FP1 TaxID=2724076 RepID=UPI0013E99E6E|nr:flagellar assembly protein A [Clostridium sp. FP1]MBZ9636045.1 FapA family protein [Clostridium sp. FP1]